MPTFITSSDVIMALNAEEVIPNVEYRIYGEVVKKTMIDKHTEYANDFVTIYTGDIDATSEKWIPAKLAALNLAMIRVVVTALGIVLYDNVNYQVGEIQVTTAPHLEQIIRANLQQWGEDLRRNLSILSPSLITTTPRFADKGEIFNRGYTLSEVGEG
jgi:hypothetical protein